MTPPRRRSTGLQLEQLEARYLLDAAPTAVDDAFSVDEDTSLVVAEFDFASDFNGSNSAPLMSTGATWQYLDQIQNNLGRSDGYPTDTFGNDWNDPEFDVANSTPSIGAWSAGPTPLVAGTINAVQGAPSVLFGIDAAPNGENLINTYLFRHDLELSAQQAAEPEGFARLLCDDGCIVYINGVEAARLNMNPNTWAPGGALTTQTTTTQQNTGNENNYTDVPLDFSNLQRGSNIIAVEVHQADTGSSDIGFDLEILAGGSNTDGFVYSNGTFGGNSNFFAEGTYEASAGFTGGAVQVRLNRGFGGFGGDASGGWSKDFTLPIGGTAQISGRYRMILGESLEANEFGEAILTIDGVRYGNDQGDTLIHQVGDGNGGGPFDSNWRQFSFDVNLTEGNHELTLGAYRNQSNGGNEHTIVRFDDIEISFGSVSSVLLNDSDDDGDLLTVSLVPDSGPSHGTLLEFLPNGSFVYVPEENYFGPDQFSYVASDGVLDSAPATVTIDVISVNDRPVVSAKTYDLVEDETLSVDVASGLLSDATDSDNIQGDLSALLVTQPGHGVVTLNPDGSFEYEPTLNFEGVDSFRYSAFDGADASFDVTVLLNVEGRNDAPIVNDDTYQVQENLILTVDGLNPVGETIALVERGSVWRYLDDGSDQGTLWRDPNFDDSAWVPEGGPNTGGEYGYGDGDETTTVGFGPNENNKFVTTYFRHYFNVADANTITSMTLSLLRDDGAAVYLNGTELVRSNLDAGAGSGTLAGPLTVGGLDESTFFSFEVDLASLVSGQNVLAVEVHQANTDSSDISFNLGLTATVLEGFSGVLVNDRDPEGDSFTAQIDRNPEHGSLSFNENGTFVYTPEVNYEGIDTFAYTASDGSDQSQPATVTITVTPGPNDIPVSEPDEFSGEEDQPLIVDTLETSVLSNDTDGDGEPLTAVLQTQASFGTVALASDGTFEYTPNEDFFGTDSFTYSSDDNSDLSKPVTVTLNINGSPDPPEASDDHYFAEPATTIVVDKDAGFLANDVDVDGDSITALLISSPVEGELIFSEDGSFSYTPALGFAGDTSFAYRSFDGALVSQIATVIITVDGSPVANDVAYQVAEDTLLAVNAIDGVLRNDNDPENDPLAAFVVIEPEHGSLSLASDGSFTYLASPDYFGQDAFAYVANDGDQISTLAMITISVEAVNDSPQATADAYDVVTGGELAVGPGDGLLANDIDVDGPQLTTALAEGGDVLFGTLTLSADGSFTYVPDDGFVGEDSFTYVATDGLLSTVPTTVLINVSPLTQLIAINEIMYHPASENDAEEYIELINLGIGSVSTKGWRINKGVDFTFPEVEIPSGGYLVVAADVVAFSAIYPDVTSVVGGWTGRLSNSGETIEIEDGLGQRIDQISYADEGDWAVRRVGPAFRGYDGWQWVTLHDGLGRSLELINPAVSNKRGQNWASSTVDLGTPGAVNTVATDETAPLIWDVEHGPAIPLPDEAVTVLAKLADVEDAQITATVMYRVSTQNSGPFQSALMFDDGLHGDRDAGDGLYGATLPGQPNGTVVEFYVQGSNDSGFTRTWPGPSDDVGNQETNLLYQVDNSVNGGDQPFYRFVMTVPENEIFRDPDRGRNSNAQMNATLISFDGAGVDIRYNVGLRLRGSGSRSRNPFNIRVNIPSDRPWQGVTAINLNTQFTHSQLVGMKLHELAGLAFEDATAVQVRSNGENRAQDNEVQFGSYVRLEVPGGDFSENHFPLDSGGNFYRGNGRLEYLGENEGSYVNQYPKSTNSGENDYSDIVALTRALDPVQTPDEVFVETVNQIINVDQWMRFFAVNSLLVNEENGLINGNQDDYSMYRGILDPRFTLVPHDMDTVFAEGDRSADTARTNRDLYNELRINPRLARLFDQPEYLQRYQFHLLDLSETLFSAEVLNPLLDNLLSDFVPTEVIDRMKTFAAGRVAYVISQISGLPTISALPTAVISGAPEGTIQSDDATLSVSGRDITQYRFSVNDGPFSARRAIAEPIVLTGLPDGQYTVRVIGRSTVGVWQSDDKPSMTGTWTVQSEFPAVRLSEVLADNFTAFVHEGTMPDFIELVNDSDTIVDISGMSLSDRVDTPGEFVFPGNTTLDPGAYLIVYADSEFGNSGLHTGFSLSRTGEGVYLFDIKAGEESPPLLDSVEFGVQATDLSLSRDEQLQWRAAAPTPGAANAPLPVGDPTGVQINEWLTAGGRLFADDRIELYNPDPNPVAIGGLFLTDNPNGDPLKHKIAPLSFISGGGFSVFIADESTNKGADHVDFKLSPHGESIGLIDPQRGRIDVIIYGPQNGDISQGRIVDGDPLFAKFNTPTLGLPNDSTDSLPDVQDMLNHLRITELMYHPEGDRDEEFIEIQNTGETTIDLAGVKIQGGVDFVFPEIAIGPGEFIVVVKDLVKFQALYGVAVRVAGEYSSRLSNGGENIELTLPAPFGASILDFTYLDSWEPTTDGDGFSLVVVDANADIATWDLRVGWRASHNLLGSPGREDVPGPALLGDLDNDNAVGVTDVVILQQHIGTVGGALYTDGDLNGDGSIDATDFRILVSNYGRRIAPAPSPSFITATGIVPIEQAVDETMQQLDASIGIVPIDLSQPIRTRLVKAAVDRVILDRLSVNETDENQDLGEREDAIVLTRDGSFRLRARRAMRNLDFPEWKNLLQENK